MKKGEVIDFEILRIQTELDYFNRTRKLPHMLLDGRVHIDEILDLHYANLSVKHQEIALDLIKDYDTIVSNTINDMRKCLTNEYMFVMDNLVSNHDSFRFKFINEKYRDGLNLLRALYYEVREVSRRFNSEDPDHQWIVSTLTDINYKNIILDALATDLEVLKGLVKKYYRPLVTHKKSVPLELFHAKQMIDDFEHYYETFLQFDLSGFDE